MCTHFANSCQSNDYRGAKIGKERGKKNEHHKHTEQHEQQDCNWSLMLVTPKTQCFQHRCCMPLFEGFLSD